jgi:hypothetical protein
MDGVHLINPESIKRAFEVPDWFRDGFHETLEANPKFKPKILPAIVTAVEASFNHRDTKMRGEIPVGEIRRRIGVSCGLVVKMYFERKMSLSQTFDLLPGVLIDMLRMGSETSAIILPQQGRWAVDSAPAELAVSDDDLNTEKEEEPDDVDES